MTAMLRRSVLAAALLGLGLAPAAAQGRPVLVFAAASLQTALSAIGRSGSARRAKRATFSFAASSALARQIEQGAPADLFASADLDWMAWAEERALVKRETRRAFWAIRWC